MRKQLTNSLICTVWMLMGFLSFAIAQVSTNTVKYKVTYSATTQTYTAWVVPDYNVPNANNSGTTEKGGTAQFTIVVPKDFVVTEITDIKGTWSKPTDGGFTKLGPGNAGQTWTGLNPNLNYYVIGKTPSETDYGTFASGTAVALFSFKGNGCFGPINPLPAGDAFIAAADNTYSLNVANSFYSRSGQSSGGNVIPSEQFVSTTGEFANCSIAATLDVQTVGMGASVISVLANDKTGNGSAATLTNVTPPTITTMPTKGTATVNPDGTLNYTPTMGSSGTDMLVYQICDKVNPTVCDTAKVTITITAAPVPSANPDNTTVVVGTPKVIMVLSNDMSATGTPATLSNVTTPTVTVVPTKGTATVNTDGTISYTANAGTTGTDTFVYQICDKVNTTSCDTARITIAITAAPVPSANPDNTTVVVGTPKVISVLSNDMSATGTPATLSNVTTPTVTVVPTKGTATVNTDGTISYTANAGATGTDTFVYRICDKVNTTSCDTARITITLQKAGPGTADLKITKTVVGSNKRAINDMVTYTVIVKNYGPDAATNVMVQDSASSGLVLMSGVANKGTYTAPFWTIPSIASGDSAVLTVNAKISGEGVSFNFATIKAADQTDSDPTDNKTSACVTVPIKICTGQSVTLSVPSNYTDVVWRDAQNSVVPSSGNSITLTQAGIYTFTASNGTCPTGGCCPVIIENAADCCPVNLCIPFTVVKRKIR